MKTITILTFLVMTICLIGTDQTFAVVFEDDFDGDELELWWTVEYANNLEEWTYDVSDGALNVYDLDPIEWTDVGGCIECYSIVTLNTEFFADSDFRSYFEIGWDSENSDHAIQKVAINFLNEYDEVVISGGYNDGWGMLRGSKFGIIGENYYYSGSDDLEYSGAGYIEILRVDNFASVWWWQQPDQSDKILLVEDVSNELLRKLQLIFTFYPKIDRIFGTESVHYVLAESLVCDQDNDGYFKEICGGSDCDDENIVSYPGADEICDGEDNDCDGELPVDENDEDNDNWMICENDCDDLNPEANPGHLEIPDNGIDDDCDDVIDEQCFISSLF